MSRITVAAALLATVALGACAKHHSPQVMEPAPQPIYVEPVATTKY